MYKGIITLGIIIIIVSIMIYVIKNIQNTYELIQKLKEKKSKKFKMLKYATTMVIAFIVVIFLYNNIKNIYSNIDSYIEDKEYLSRIKDQQNIIYEQNSKYKEIFNKEYKDQKYSEPYIPGGFIHIDGTYNSGFVISDDNGNEFVWVPCTNQQIDGISKLQKINFTRESFISKDICYEDSNYEEFLKSALENGGFYISRYEIGIENNKPVSKMGVETYTKGTKNEKIEMIAGMYENNNFHHELINGYAYDTTLAWIMNTNEIKEADEIVLAEEEKESHKKIVDGLILSDEIIYAGRNKYNNIFDIMDDLLELTSEMSYDACIVRRFLNNPGFIDKNSRYAALEDETNFNIAVRTMLYK